VRYGVCAAAGCDYLSRRPHLCSGGHEGEGCKRVNAVCGEVEVGVIEYGIETGTLIGKKASAGDGEW
jgi:hypothetical protein